MLRRLGSPGFTLVTGKDFPVAPPVCAGHNGVSRERRKGFKRQTPTSFQPLHFSERQRETLAPAPQSSEVRPKPSNTCSHPLRHTPQKCRGVYWKFYAPARKRMGRGCRFVDGRYRGRGWEKHAKLEHWRSVISVTIKR